MTICMLTLPPPSKDKNKPLIWGTKVDFGKERHPPENYLKICLEQHGKMGQESVDMLLISKVW